MGTAAFTASSFVAPVSVMNCKLKTAVSNSNNHANLREVKGIIFDVDGTLADSFQLGFDATQAVLKKNQIALISPDEYHAFTRYTTQERLARHTGLDPEHQKGEFEKVGARLADEFDDLYVDLVNMDTAAFFDGINGLITAIPSGIKVGALTNACVAYARAVLATNGVTERFCSIHGADSVPRPKPFADGLFLVCKEMGLEPSECVYIGDSPSDGEAAYAAGMGAVGVIWGSHSLEKVAEAPFDVVCSSLTELDSVLSRAYCKNN